MCGGSCIGGLGHATLRRVRRHPVVRFERCGDMDMESAFRVLAAVELARRGRLAEVGAYTNALPESALAVFEEEAQ